MVSTSASPIQNSFKYDVFLSYRGEDTRKNIVDHLYHALKDKGIYTYKDDEKIHKGERIKLVKIMECHKISGHIAYPLFYDVEATEVRNQSGSVRKAFFKNKNKQAAEKWKVALKEAADLAGWELKNTLDGHQAKFIKKIVQEISLELRSINFGFDEKLVGMETRVKDVVSYLEIGIDEVRMLGIKGMGGAGKTTIARAVFDHVSADFEAKSFVENVREVSNGSVSGSKNLQEQVLSDVVNERVTLNGVNDGKDMMKRRMRGKKFLLVLDDVDHIDQLKALAGEPKWFKLGSRILITTRDEQVLVAHRVNMIHDIVLLSKQEAISLFSRHAFGRENPLQGYEELSGKVVSYAAGLPLTLEVLGSFLCGKDRLEWVDAIDRLKRIPLKDILEKLELSYISLEDEYKEIFLDIACILKGGYKEKAIKCLESCGFHARIGLKVLEQRSLITISKDEYLGMHDHIEEMGKNIVRHSHPDEHNKHSRLWIDEETEDILANDMGTEATRCLKFDMSRRNERIFMKGLGKMKKLRYLEVKFASDAGCLDDTSQYFSNSLKYLKCGNYPFLYLPKTFQAKNLVGLDMYNSRTMVQLWEEGEKKVLKKIKFLSLSESNLTTFDFRITPNLETLSLNNSFYLKELLTFRIAPNLEKLTLITIPPNLVGICMPLVVKATTTSVIEINAPVCMPVTCQKLNYLHITRSKLITFDVGLTPNLETLSLCDSADFVELHVPVVCPNLKFLDLSKSRLRSLDLELIPNLERLELQECHELVEINAPIGCLQKVRYLNLCGYLSFTHFKFHRRCEPKVHFSSATLALFGESRDLCPLHPNSNLPKFQFNCTYNEYLWSSVGNIEKLVSFGRCACTDFKEFSDIICSLQYLRKLKLECNIPEFPKDLGQSECLEELFLYSTKIKQLPDSICKLKRLKTLEVKNSDLLEKLPEDLGQLECLEKLYVSSKKIEYLPDSICMLKRLKSLDVPNCCRLGKLPEDIGQLEYLERLALWATTIKHLPDSICMLKLLKFLNLSLCALLEKLPEDLGRLECLEHLDITYTHISHLPQSIFGLKGLNIAASQELLQLYDFSSEINTTTSHFRLIDIIHPTAQTIDPLMQLDPSAGLDVETDLTQRPVKEVSNANLVRDMFMFDNKREGQLLIKQFLKGDYCQGQSSGGQTNTTVESIDKADKNIDCDLEISKKHDKGEYVGVQSDSDMEENESSDINVDGFANYWKNMTAGLGFSKSMDVKDRMNTLC
ncbi:disease resistance TIR-NBS-LRR class family protein [Tanacetum coccineum]